MSYISLDSEDFNQAYIEDILGDYISGVAGIDRNNVRPAHQALHPTFKQNSTICLFNIHRVVKNGMWFGSIDNYADRQELHIHIFFYGVDGFNYLNKLMKNSYIRQNTFELAQHNMAVMDFSDVYEIPVNINGIEVVRHDVTMRVSIAREIKYKGTYIEKIDDVRICGGQKWH